MVNCSVDSSRVKTNILAVVWWRLSIIYVYWHTFKRKVWTVWICFILVSSFWIDGCLKSLKLNLQQNLAWCGTKRGYFWEISAIFSFNKKTLKYLKASNTISKKCKVINNHSLRTSCSHLNLSCVRFRPLRVNLCPCRYYDIRVYYTCILKHWVIINMNIQGSKSLWKVTPKQMHHLCFNRAAMLQWWWRIRLAAHRMDVWNKRTLIFFKQWSPDNSVQCPLTLQ